MDLRMLGPFELWDGNHQFSLDSRIQRALVALLAIHANEVVSTDRLVDGLWGDDPPSAPLQTLRYHVSKLRSALGDAAIHVVTRSPGYVLELDRESIDVHRFEDLAAEGRGLIVDEPERAARMLVDALGMWRGFPLADFTYESFARAEIIRLEELRLAVLEDRIDADLASGRHADLVGELEPLTTEYPLRERLWGQLMTAFYRTGRQAEALRAYQQARDALGEIGIEPSEELRVVEEQVLLQDPVLQAVRQPVRRHNLPERLSGFVGRVDETATVGDLLAKHRLVTLTGIGGVGKTSLAIEASRTLIDAFEDGIWLVSLADVADAALIPERLAFVLGVHVETRAGLVGQLGGYLSEREMLVVFDACERHVDSVAELAEVLLAAAHSLRVLATSREPLEVAGEVRFVVPVLESDGIDADAVRLFSERANLVQPGFETTTDNVDMVAEVCRRVAGIPLAVELAAARLGSLTLQQIDDRLDDQMALLARGRRRDESHHDSVQATLDWSYDLLGVAEQILFRRLAVFQGGFAVEAAEKVCSDDALLEDMILDLLTRLADVSLVVVNRETARFQLLDPVQQYAERHLESAPENDVILRRHGLYYRDLARLAFEGMYGPDEIYWTQVCLAEESNHRAAISSALTSGDVRIALDIAGSLGYFWWQAGLSSAARSVYEAIPASSGELASREMVLVLEQVSMQEQNNDVAAAIGYAEQALDVATTLGDEFAIGVALDTLGCATWTIDNHKAIAYISKAADTFRKADHGRIVYELNQMAWMLCDQLDESGESLERAAAAAEDALNQAQRLRFPDGLAVANRVTGLVSMYRGEVDVARAYLAAAKERFGALHRRRSLIGVLRSQADNELIGGSVAAAAEHMNEIEALHRESGTSPDAFDLSLFGRVCLGTGDVAEGMRYLRKALLANHAAGAEEGTAYILWLLSNGFLLDDEPEVATRVLAAFRTTQQRLRRAFPVLEEQKFQQHLFDLSATLGEEAFNQAWAEGEDMGIDDAVADSLNTLQVDPAS